MCKFLTFVNFSGNSLFFSEIGGLFFCKLLILFGVQSFFIFSVFSNTMGF